MATRSLVAATVVLLVALGSCSLTKTLLADKGDSATCVHDAPDELDFDAGGEVDSAESDEADEEIASDLHDVPFEVLITSLSSVNVTTTKVARKKPVQWVHVCKSGGTFMCAMAGIAGESIVAPASNCNWEQHDTAREGSGNPGKAVSCTVRHNFLTRHHSTWGQIERELYVVDACYENFEYGIMLRSPLSRMHSRVNFKKHATPRAVMFGLRRRVRSNVKDSDPSHHAEWKQYDNFALRVLVPGAMDAPAGMIGMAEVAAAKAILAHFTYVQRLEDLPATAPKFFERLGWPQKMKWLVGRKVNHNTDLRQKDFSEEDVAWLQQLHKPEQALYEWAASVQVGR